MSRIHSALVMVFVACSCAIASKETPSTTESKEQESAQARIPSNTSEAMSDFEKGLICRTIEEKYANAMRFDRTKPKWLVCRSSAVFNKRSPNYTIATPGINGGTLNCQATMGEVGSQNAPAVVYLNCQ